MIDNSNRMSLEELEKTQEYQRLTQKQRLFVATYCEGGRISENYDPVMATNIAYKCKSMEVARIMSYSLMANIRIIAILNRHFGTQPVDEFLAVLDRAINNKKITIAQLGALKLKCDILGLANKLPHGGSSAVPNEVQEATRAARKSQRKPRVDKPKEDLNADHDFNNLQF